MSSPRWVFRKTTQLQDFIESQEAAVQRQIAVNIEKLETRGVNGAREPLVGHMQDDVYYLRCNVEGYGWFRCFFFRDGPTSFCGFFGLDKKTNRIPRRVAKQIMQKFNELKSRGK